jgi:HlyD family secretion protein
MTRSIVHAAAVAAIAGLAAACGREAPEAAARASGFVEATEVQLAFRVPGRVATVDVAEGQTVAAGATVATLGTDEIDLALQRARADRAQAAAQLRLLEAGPRVEDVRQAEAQRAAAAADVTAAAAERDAAAEDEARFARLVERNAGAVKARDDAAARRALAEARLLAARDRVAAADAVLARVRAGARREEIAAAAARVAAVDAQIASLDHDRADTVLRAPSPGIVSSRLVEPGEWLPPGQPAVVLLDLANAWANAYVEEPLVPALRVGGAATVVTDAGDRVAGTITFISPRAEFTPRNVQTADERARLVFRVKVSVDNARGVLKPGMPVEVEFEGVTR